jgi:crossover junction endodeoxyribonuclease RuvC
VRIVGIDPGLTGGLALLDLTLTPPVVRLVRTPAPLVKLGRHTRRHYDVPAMWKALVELTGYDPHGAALVALERVSTRPGQHAASTLQTGVGFGLWQGLCAARQVAVVLVAPQSWKRHHGLLHADKRASRFRAAERFPRLGSLPAADEGPAEALLLAAYAAATFHGWGGSDHASTHEPAPTSPEHGRPRATRNPGAERNVARRAP